MNFLKTFIIPEALMKSSIVITSIFLSSCLYAQQSAIIKIEDCYQLAEKNYPLLKQKGILDSVLQLKQKNWNTGYLPQISLNAQATYQSDVTEISMGEITLPAMGMAPPQTIKMQSPDPMSKDQYKVTLDINQLIYDGGNIRKNKALDELTTQIDQQNIEVEMYKLKDRINAFFLAILFYQENEALLNVVKKDLTERLKKTQALINNGAGMQVNANILEAEIMKVEMQLTENIETKHQYIKMLNILTDTTIAEQASFQMPTVNYSSTSIQIRRPEHDVFQLQQNKLDKTASLFKVRTTPKIYAFAQTGYGKPGLNMLSTDFDYFYIVGAKFTWNIWNWKQNQRETKILKMQSDIIQIQQETFNLNQKILAAKEIGDIEKFNQLIEKDEKLLELRKQIIATYATMLDNGTITSTEYINEVNNHLQVSINKKMHEIQKTKAIINYKYIAGE